MLAGKRGTRNGARNSKGLAPHGGPISNLGNRTRTLKTQGPSIKLRFLVTFTAPFGGRSRDFFCGTHLPEEFRLGIRGPSPFGFAAGYGFSCFTCSCGCVFSCLVVSMVLQKSRCLRMLSQHNVQVPFDAGLLHLDLVSFSLTSGFSEVWFLGPAVCCSLE